MNATSVLSGANLPSADVDAHELVAFVLDVPRTRLHSVTGLTLPQVERLETLLKRRAAREPLQHITGRAPFRYVELAVGPGVFVPRPETEILVDLGLAAVARIDAPVVVDLCSGSGAIARAVAHERVTARVYAVERDDAALGWLRRNSEGTSITVVPGDATDPDILCALDGSVDLVLCNPPYVPDGTPVPPEVAAHDPAVAVFGGADGLDVIRGIAARAAGLLRAGGTLAIEHDETHADGVVDLLRAGCRFDRIVTHPDLVGRPRFATAVRLGD
jgi:release factor glutamine methyltransferase